ncbi:MAG: hypothetical protein U5N55_12220 [Cypionkella sp.]|nr:hypothetical protein [Cypionkella sp.]
MATTTDFTKVMQDMMAKFPMDTTAMQTAFQTQAAFAEKMSKVALEAAEKSTELSAQWTKDTLAKLSGAANCQGRSLQITPKAATDFASLRC